MSEFAESQLIVEYKDPKVVDQLLSDISISLMKNMMDYFMKSDVMIGVQCLDLNLNFRELKENSPEDDL